MRQRSVWTAGWLVLGILLGAAPAHAQVTPVAGFDEQLFPSYLIATASLKTDKTSKNASRLGDPMGLLGVDIVALEDDTPIRVTIECDDIMEPSVFSGTLAEAGTSYRVTPKVKYRYGNLAAWEQAEPVTITFRIQVGQNAEEELAVTCTMRSINDCPFAFRNGDQAIDASFTFAAYVNEQHPFVDKLLREALDRDVVRKFTGYQSGRPEEVVLQAYAIWDLLVARDIRYSSITATAASSDSVASQHVRLIEDSINNSQANCVDGSVVWVSMLRKIGIDAFLVVTANHCYAGFYTDPQRKNVYAVETTLLGAEITEEEVTVPKKIGKAIPEELRYSNTFASFVAALEVGTKAYDSQVRKRKESDPQAAVVIDIATVRRAGVLPIAFRNDVEFVGYDFRITDDETSDDAASDEEMPAEEMPADENTAETSTEEASSEDTTTEESDSETTDTAKPAPRRQPKKPSRGPSLLDEIGSGVRRK